MIRRVLLIACAAYAPCVVSGADRLKFPTAPKRPVIDRYFEVEIRDDYQWLEQESDPAVQKFATQQNERARRWFDRQPQRAVIEQQLEAWETRSSIDHGRLIDTPAGLFALISAPDKQQRYIVRLASVDDPANAVPVVDPNRIDPTGATAIDWWVPSPGGKLIAVCLSQKGSEVGTLHFFDAAKGTQLPDRIPRVQAPTAGGSVAWTADETAVFYTRYPAPGERPESDLRFFQQVFQHRLGTDPAQDTYAVGKEFPRIAEIELKTSPDGLFTLAQVSNGDGGDYAFFLRPADAAWEQIASFDDGVKKAVLADDGMLYLLSRSDAARGQILRTSLAQPDVESATPVVPQGEGVIRDFVVHDGRLYVSELAGGVSRLHQFSTDGSSSRTIALPADSAIIGLVARLDGTLLVRLTRYVEPPAWHLFNPTRSNLRKTALAVASPATFADVQIERFVATAADGTGIPITVLSRYTTQPRTAGPLLLQAYGAYGATNEPSFIAHRRLWFDAGGTIAIAHVRGGGDFGETWHKAGNLEKKQTTFSDFIACAERLVALGRTRAELLAIQGGSAGGLLMGAALTQRPDLFRAVVSRVGIYDSLRVERAPNGEFNTTEFGTVKNRDQFFALRAYSPYHRAVDGTAYPAILLTTGMHDGRVPPGQSFKMAARLQAATSSKHPVLLRVDSGAGHGIGSSRSSRLDETADIYAFLFVQLGMAAGGKP